MVNKRELQEIIDGLSEEEAISLQKMIETGIGPKPKKKRRGKGRTKQKSGAPKPLLSDEGFMDGVALTQDERREIEAASKFDKEKGLDKPKPDGIIPKSPGFQKVEAKCMDCGKTSRVSPALLPPEADRFKCNKCSCRR